MYGAHQLAAVRRRPIIAPVSTVPCLGEGYGSLIQPLYSLLVCMLFFRVRFAQPIALDSVSHDSRIAVTLHTRNTALRYD